MAVSLLVGENMAYPYYYYYPTPYPFDPFTLMYMWMSQWTYMISMMYYMEMLKAMMETWRKFAETTFKPEQ